MEKGNKKMKRSARVKEELKEEMKNVKEREGEEGIGRGNEECKGVRG